MEHEEQRISKSANRGVSSTQNVKLRGSKTRLQVLIFLSLHIIKTAHLDYYE